MKVNFETDKISQFLDVPSSLPPFDIIVISHDNLQLTSQCVTSVIDQTSAPFHLIVVDDSKDLTPDYIRSLKRDNITLVHSETPYQEGNSCINAGLQHTKHEVVAVLTNSMTVSMHWEVHALNLLQKHADIGVIGIKILNPAGVIEDAGMLVPQNGDPYDIGYGLTAHNLTNMYECPCVPWCCVLLRRCAVKTLPEGIYHPFRGWDDIDNCFVLKSEGWKVIYSGYGAAYHLACATRGTADPEARKKSIENGVRFRKRWEL